MSIHIGEIIAKYRKKKGCTQEQLSHVFGVSVAAVSKWETGMAAPDIALLPLIASYFDISIDRLFDYELDRTNLSISEHFARANELLLMRKEQEAIAYLGDLAYRYPNNAKIRIKYAEAKIHFGAHGSRGEASTRLFREAEAILRSINPSFLDNNERGAVQKALYGLYLWEKKYDQAEMILRELKPDDDFWSDIDSAFFWLYAHKGDIEKSKEQYNALLQKPIKNEWLVFGPYHMYD